MAVAVTADDIIEMAKINRGLPEDERDALIEAIPKMNQAALGKTQTLLLELGDAHLATKKQELSIISSIEQIIQRNKNKKRQAQESQEHAEDEAAAEDLLSNL